MNFFRLHDTSADRKLDGLELLSALSHGINSYIVRMEERDKPLPPERISKMYDNIQSKLTSCNFDYSNFTRILYRAS